jgi:putative spermidine/putrescine transport system permease protein
MMVLLGVFFALPLLMVVSLAFRPFDAKTLVGDEVTIRNFARFLFDGFYLDVFLRTMLIAVTTTVASVLLGYPVAWHLRTLSTSRARAWLTLVVLLPLTLSLVISSFAWLIILGSNGILNNLLTALGALQHPIQLLNTSTGVIIVTVYSFLPYTVLSIYAALENIDPSLGRAARIHGASDTQAFLRVTLPLSLPGVVSGALIVFALAMAAFVIPYLVGGGRVKVVPLLIYNFTVQLFDWPGAAALSVLLVVLTLGLTWLVSRLGERLTPWERSR